MIYLGPRAIEVLRPFLKPDPAAYLFSPKDVVADLRRRGVGGQGPRFVNDR
jgi:hypothetical protein